jgi:hypothetical protein
MKWNGTIVRRVVVTDRVWNSKVTSVTPQAKTVIGVVESHVEPQDAVPGVVVWYEMARNGHSGKIANTKQQNRNYESCLREIVGQLPWRTWCCHLRCYFVIAQPWCEQHSNSHLLRRVEKEIYCNNFDTNDSCRVPWSIIGFGDSNFWSDRWLAIFGTDFHFVNFPRSVQVKNSNRFWRRFWR